MNAICIAPSGCGAFRPCYISHFFVLRNKRRDEELDEEEINEQEASSSTEDVAESASNEETDNTALDTGKSYI